MVSKIILKKLLGECTVGGVNVADVGAVSHTVLLFVQVSGTSTAFTILDTFDGVGCTGQTVEGLGEAIAMLAEGFNQFGHTQATGVGFHRLDGLELESNLVLDGGVRGHLHREYRVD